MPAFCICSLRLHLSCAARGSGSNGLPYTLAVNKAQTGKLFPAELAFAVATNWSVVTTALTQDGPIFRSCVTSSSYWAAFLLCVQHRPHFKAAGHYSGFVPSPPHLLPGSLWSFVFVRSHLLSSRAGEQPSSELELLPIPYLASRASWLAPRNTLSYNLALPLTRPPSLIGVDGVRACKQKQWYK